jgi:hypothetical protein
MSIFHNPEQAKVTGYSRSFGSAAAVIIYKMWTVSEQGANTN